MPITPIESWRKDVYIASLTSVTKNSGGDQTSVYSSPVAFNMNVQPLDDDARIEMFGANSKEMFRALIIGVGHGIKKFDVAYLNGASPTGEVKNGANSNFVVRRVQEKNISTTIYFESIKGQ